MSTAADRLANLRDAKAELQELLPSRPNDPALLDAIDDLDGEIDDLLERIDAGEFDAADLIESEDADEEDTSGERDLNVPFFTNYPRYSWELGRFLAPKEQVDGRFAPERQRPGYPRLVAAGLLPQTIQRRHQLSPLA